MANKLYRLVTLDRSRLSISISQSIRQLSGVSQQTPHQEAPRSTSEKEEKDKVEEKEREEPRGDGDGEEVGGVYVNKLTGEVGGPRGPEPTRYGDWEKGGRCSDF